MSSTDIARRLVAIVEIDLDRCLNTYGVSPCTATGGVGTECYNTRSTCQATSVYNLGTHTYRFCSVGAPLPSDGQYVRPYVSKITSAPTVIDPDKGLAQRSSTTVAVLDETDSDTELDPYFATRPTVPLGTFWTRLIARNQYYAMRTVRVKRGLFKPDNYGSIGYTVGDAEFSIERYVLTTITGPDSSGKITLTLKDPSKLTDTAMVPAATSGALAVQGLPADDINTARGGSLTTITLATSASSTDGAFVNAYVTITGGTGNGQSRTINAYVGSTRVATVSAAWGTAPDSTSTYQVEVLQAPLTPGTGVQYTASGYICINNEIIQYTSNVGDVLSWPDFTYRAKFGTTQAAHSATTNVQQCAVWVNIPWTTVMIDIMENAGMLLSDIDTAGFTAQETTWLGSKYAITTCIAAPEKASTLLAELAKQAMGVLWWSPVEQLMKFAVTLPTPQAVLPTPLTDAANLMEGATAVTTLDANRLSMSALYYSPVDYSRFKSEPSNYSHGVISIDTSAESAAEYGVRMAEYTYSRWLSSPQNDLAVIAWVARRVAYYRDAPKQITASLDPKDGAFNPGSFLQLQTRRLTDNTGRAATATALVTSRDNTGPQIDVTMRTLPLNKRYAFIAPAGYPPYSSCSPTQHQYAFIAGNSDTMSNGDPPYRVI